MTWVAGSWGWRRSFAALFCLSFFSCGPTVDDPTEARLDEQGIVASYAGGTVTVDDLTAEVISLINDAGPRPNSDQEGWCRERIEAIALDRLLTTRAREQRLAERPEFVASRLDKQRQAVVERFVQRTMPKEPIDNSEIERFYEENRDLYRQPERRSLSNIFRQLEPGAELSELTAELDSVRAQVVGGASFKDLAAAHSDSETRVQGGWLGWLSADELPPQLAQIVFVTPVGTPTAPISTRDGVHLFFVQDQMDAVEMSLEESSSIIERDLELLRQQQTIVELLVEAQNSFLVEIPGVDELRIHLRDPDNTPVLLNVSDYQVTVGDVRRRLRQSGRDPRDEDSETDAVQLVLDLAARESLYQLALSQTTREGNAATGLEVDSQDRSLARFALEVAVAERADSQLQEYWTKNRRRFMTPLRFGAQLLAIPLAEGSDPGKISARLREAADPENGAPIPLIQLAEELGGETQILSPTAPYSLARTHPNLPAYLSEIRVGERTLPFVGRGSLMQAELRSREEPTLLDFDQARDQVFDRFLAQHGARLEAEIGREILSKAEFRIFPSSTALCLQGATPNAR